MSFPRRAWAALAGFALLQLVVLVVQLGLQEDQRTSVDRQLAAAVTQLRLARPVLENARPLTAQLRRDAPAAGRLVRDTAPLVRSLREQRAATQLRAAGELSRALLDADLPRAARSLDEVSGELLRQQRLRRLLVRSNGVLGEMRSRAFVAKATRAADVTSDEVAPVLRRTLALQERLLATQQEALAAIRATLEIARETERHAESIDRKTGGQAAGAPAPSPAPPPAPAPPVPPTR